MKRLSAAKSRLEPYFDARQRQDLARAMVVDALDVCSDATFLRWHVVTADEEVRALAARRGFDTIEDPYEGDLNAALSHVQRKVSGAESLTIIPVDAPLATAAELQDIVDTGALSDVVVVPAERDAGTNALYLSPPDLTEPRFGESSFSAYVRWAEGAHVRCSILPLEGLAVDIDTIEDVEKVLEDPPRETRTIALLRKLVSERP